jgi:hypothetical protein
MRPFSLQVNIALATPVLTLQSLPSVSKHLLVRWPHYVHKIRAIAPRLSSVNKREHANTTKPLL